MPAPSGSKGQRRQLGVAYDIVLVPRGGKISEGAVIGTFERGATGPKFVLHDNRKIIEELDDDTIMIESFGTFKRVLAAANALDRRPAKSATALSEDEKAKALLSEVSKALSDLATSQEDFRAELIAAYEEGEDLFKLAAG